MSIITSRISFPHKKSHPGSLGGFRLNITQFIYREKSSGCQPISAAGAGAANSKDCSEQLLKEFNLSPLSPNGGDGQGEGEMIICPDASEFVHNSVNHKETYVKAGNIHNNGIENVWSLFKRAITGVFHKVSAKYLPLYLNEFAFRFNNREHFNMMNRVLSECH